MGSGTLDKIALYAKPGKFIGKDYPLFKWVNDTVTRYHKKAEIHAETMLYDLQYVPKEHGKLLRGMKENESFKDYIARNESILDAMGMTATARSAYITQKSPDAGLTSFELLTNKSPEQAKQVADTYIKVEYDLMREAKENKENSITENSDGTY